MLRFWLKERELPLRESMLADERAEKSERLEKLGYTKRQFHMMGQLQGAYYDDLADTAGIERLPPVLTKLHNESSDRFLDNLVHYRESRYRVLDRENFVQLE